MRVHVTDTSQYITFLTGICGEVDERKLTLNLPVAENFGRKVVMKLLRLKYFRRYEYQDENYEGNFVALRLCSPNGEAALEELSQELYWHWTMMVGAKESRYKGTRSHKERLRRSFNLVQMLYDSGIMVDFMQHTYRSGEAEGDTPAESMGAFAHFVKNKTIFDTDGTLLTPDEIFSRLDKDETCYFTSRALARMNENKSGTGRNIMSRIHGVLVRNDLFYTVYYVGAGGEQWWPDVERQMIAILNRYKAEVTRERTSDNGTAIIFSQSQKTYHEMIFPVKNTKGRINPVGVYGKAYVLPLNQNHILLREILLLKNGEEKLSEALLGGDYISGEIYDGITKGYEVYNLLTNDIVRMDAIKTRVSMVPSIVIINPWQRPTVEKLYGDAVTIIEITQDKLEALYEEIIF